MIKRERKSQINDYFFLLPFNVSSNMITLRNRMEWNEMKCVSFYSLSMETKWTICQEKEDEWCLDNRTRDRAMALHRSFPHWTNEWTNERKRHLNCPQHRFRPFCSYSCSHILFNVPLGPDACWHAKDDRSLNQRWTRLKEQSREISIWSRSAWRKRREWNLPRCMPVKRSLRTVNS